MQILRNGEKEMNEGSRDEKRKKLTLTKDQRRVLKKERLMHREMQVSI